MIIQPAVQHANESMNWRSFLLRYRRMIWLVPLAAVAGALLGALIYGVIWLSMSGQRQYQQTSKYYLTFGYEENGEVADYYNAYTWNDLIFSITSISDVIEDELPDGVTIEDAQEAIEADILSDVRVLTITVTHADPDAVQQMTNAVEDALVRYGANAVQFTSIDFLSSSEVEAVVISDRTRNAVLLGAVLGFLAAAVWLWLRELLDDGIYVPEDAVRRYGIPVRVILPAEGTQLPDFLLRENNEALSAMAGTGRVSASAEVPQEASQDVAPTQASPGQPRAESRDGAPVVRLVCEEDTLAQEAADILTGQYGVKASASENAEGAIFLVIPFGRANGTRTEHRIEHLRAGGREVSGIVLTGADGRFLAQYYGTGSAKGRQKASSDT